MASLFGISNSAITKAIQNFNPIPHRLELIDEINGVKYYNDSKATNIAATEVAIESFEKDLILILGGQDKGESDFTELTPIMNNRVKTIVCYGQAGEKISKQLTPDFTCEFIQNFDDAFKKTKQIAISGDVVLLSPACASFDQFNNFEERGLKFANLVKEIGINV